MKKFGIKAVVALLVLAGGAIGGAQVLTAHRKTETTASVDPQDRRLAEVGAYIARTADCVACHSVPGDKPFAGGLAMQTPVGTIYSSNITTRPPASAPTATPISRTRCSTASARTARRSIRPCRIRRTPSCPTPTCRRLSLIHI